MHPFQWSVGTCQGPPFARRGGLPLPEFVGPGRNPGVPVAQDPYFDHTVWLEQAMKGKVSLYLDIEIVAGRLLALSGELIQRRRKTQPELPDGKSEQFLGMFP